MEEGKSYLYIQEDGSELTINTQNWDLGTKTDNSKNITSVLSSDQKPNISKRIKNRMKYYDDILKISVATGRFGLLFLKEYSRTVKT